VFDLFSAYMEHVHEWQDERIKVGDQTHIFFARKGSKNLSELAAVEIYRTHETLLDCARGKTSRRHKEMFPEQYPDVER